MKKHYLNLGIILVVFLFLYPELYDSKMFIGGDNAAYYILANGLADGAGYVNYNDPALSPANHFPPGYPFILSLFLRFTDRSIELTNYLSGAFYLLSLVTCYFLAFRLTRQRIFSLVATLFILLNRHLFEFSGITMSEIVFSLFMMLSILLFIRVTDKSRNYRHVLFYLFILCTIVTIYIRTQGIIIVGAAALFLVFRRQYLNAAIIVSVCALALLPWQVRSAKLGGNTYVKQLLSVNPYDAMKGDMKAGDWTVRIGKNSIRYFSKEIPNSVFPALRVVYNDTKGNPAPAPKIYWAIGGGIVLLLLLGVWSVREYRWFFLFFFGGTLLILLCWPDVWFGIRFILPVVPLIILFMLIGIWYALRKVFPKLPEQTFENRWALALLPLLLLQVSPLKELHTKVQSRYTPNWGNYFKMAEWTRDELPKTSVVCTRKPELFYLESGLKTTSFIYSAEEDKMFEDFEKKGITHLVIEQLGFRQTLQFLLPLVRDNPEKFELVRSLGTQTRPPVAGVWLYKYNKDLGYRGPYIQGKKEGKGYTIYANGTRIEGTWKDNKLNGPGKMTTPDSLLYEGSWKNGLKDGPFYVTNLKKRSKVLSEWHNDTLVPEGWLLDPSNRKLKKIRLAKG